MKIITYYTIDTPYEEQVDTLIESCYKYDEEIVAIPKISLGAWVKNCATKPEVIRSAMESGESLLWLDADSQILAPLDYFRELEKSGKFDIACGINYNNQMMQSGTVWIASNKITEKMLERWENGCIKNPHIWDQKTMQKIIESMIKGNGLRLKRLDNKFCFRIPQGKNDVWETVTPDNTVIVQHQRSRKFKRIIDRNEQIVKTDSLTFDKLREANVERCNNYFNHSIDDWSGAEWGNAMAGEFGEVAQELSELMLLIFKFMTTMKTCDTLKKALRQLSTDKSFIELKHNLKLELADVVTYADLLGSRFDIDLGEAVREKFNIVSDKRRCDIKI